MRQLDLALVEPVIGKHAAHNFQRGAAGVRRALQEGASLIALPELWITGFGRKNIAAFLSDQNNLQTSLQELEAECAAEGAALIHGLPEKADRQLFFNSLCLPPDREERRYRKLMVYTNVEKNFVCSEATDDNLLAFEHVTSLEEPVIVAVQLCADLRFPELARAGAQLGAQLILNCSQWRACPKNADGEPAFPEHWELLVRARAIENQVYCAGCGAGGEALDYMLHGPSLVADPLGSIVSPRAEIEIEEGGHSGRLLLYQLNLDRTGPQADPQAPHFIPWIEEMTPVIEGVMEDTRAALGDAARRPRAGHVPHDIFLSHAAQDHSLAETLVEQAANRGLSVFFAPKSLEFGAEFGEDIRRALTESRELWLLVTPISMESQWVMTEWGAAWALGKTIIPILLQVPPENLPDRLRSRHAVNYHDSEELLEQAVRRKQGLGADD